MKTSKQDIQDLLSQLAADIEEIKAMLSSGAAGNPNAISNDVAIGNGSTTANADRIIAEINRRLELIAQTCGKFSSRLKSYYTQLLLRIPQDFREELNRDNDTRKRKGLPTIENKIDNSLTMLVSIYDRLTQLEDALRLDTPKSGQSGQIAAHSKYIRYMSANDESTHEKSTHGNAAKTGIMARLQSTWSWMRQFHSKRPVRWHRNPYILCAIVIYLLYFGLSIFSWTQWHHYRDENARLRLAADKYRVDSIILRELYPQAAITLSAYEHITESQGADAAIEVFRNNLKKINKQKTSSTR